MTKCADETLKCRALIVGGGLAGLTLAARLGGAGLDTIVVDRESRQSLASVPYDGRTTAISYGSRRILDAAGLWAALEPDAEPILDIRIADDRQPLFLHFDHREMEAESNGQPFGHIVDNRLIRLAQFAALDELESVTHLAPATVTALDRSAEIVTATLADGRKIKAEIVIGADGRGSMVRQDASIGLRRWRYNQYAIVCTIAHAKPHNGLALEHFMPEGPFAVLPMTDAPKPRGKGVDHRSSIVWTERPTRADYFLNAPVSDFNAALNERMGDYLGKARLLGKRFRYPLGVLHARRYTDTRMALIGEAAHAIHPIAGQGLNLGLRDVALLSELLVDRARLGLDLGDPQLLASYQRRRRPDNSAMLATTDVLNRLFSNRVLPIRAARGLGLEMVGRLPPLKRFFMRQAMGLGPR
ncbi:MAG: UbiH/UbiF/VisC/COQ6 family ubiquinone biosynthesis hydroxylase [Pseudomonadota bacterium]